MITAQVLACVAAFVSWIWWVSMILNVGGLVLLQLPWCCRQNKGALIATAAVAAANSLVQIGVGIYILDNWKRKDWCDPFTFYTDDDNDYSDYIFYLNDTNLSDYCAEEAWGSVAIICGMLWAWSAICVSWFVGSGMHAKWEEKYLTEAATSVVARGVEVELGGPPVLTTAVTTTMEDNGPVITTTASVVELPLGKEDIPTEATQEPYEPPSVIPASNNA